MKWDVGGIRLEASSRSFRSKQNITGLALLAHAWKNRGVRPPSNPRFRAALNQQYSANLSWILAREAYTILYYTILYYTILYYTILYYTILYYTILYDTMLCYAMLHYTILYYTILYYTILYYTILYYTILYFTILYYTILYYTIRYDTIRYNTILYYTILRGRRRRPPSCWSWSLSIIRDKDLYTTTNKCLQCLIKEYILYSK